MTFQHLVSAPAITFTPLTKLAASSAEKQYEKIRRALQTNCKVSNERLNYRTPFQLLVAAILLPQATIAEINATTPQIFKQYTDAEALQRAKRRDIEKLIRHIGFYRQKAKYLILSSQMLLTHFNGSVPKTMSNLTRLPGVARRAANLILGELYGRADGIIVDTRVKRVTERLGIASGKSAEAIENDLMQLLPNEDWLIMPQLIMSLADTVCTIKAPKCAQCPLHAVCRSAQ